MIWDSAILRRVKAGAASVALAAVLLPFCSPPNPVPASQPTALELVTARLKQEEGFRAHAYRDTQGVLTIGFGTNLDQGITIREADLLLWNRAEIKEGALSREWVPYRAQPLAVRVELLDMAYQLGVEGLLRFELMLGALARGDYETAAREALNSVLDHETPSRVERVASVFRAQVQ